MDAGWHRAYLSLGSNIDPEMNLALAFSALRGRFEHVRFSPVYRTASVGFDGADFLNAAAVLDTRLSPQELVALQWEDLDLEEGVCHVVGHAARALPLAPAFAAALASLAGERTGPVLVARGGAAIDAAGLAGLVAAAAYDAGLATPADVTPDALRHTYVAFLVRQGARFADLGRRVGDIPPAAFVGYGPLSPPGPGRPLDEIRQDYPLPA